jgi:hypothetical protein
MTIEERFKALQTFAQAYTHDLQREMQRRTGIGNFRCYPHDEFISAFAEDHLTRAGDVLISLRVTLDLKGYGDGHVRQLKARLGPLAESLERLRANFEDSRDAVDFDWHISEFERKQDEGKAFAESVLRDCERLGEALNLMAHE